MEWRELRETCDRYGIEVSYVPGEEQYRFYNWRATAPYVRVYDYMSTEELTHMAPAVLEGIVVEYALRAMELDNDQ